LADQARPDISGAGAFRISRWWQARIRSLRYGKNAIFTGLPPLNLTPSFAIRSVHIEEPEPTGLLAPGWAGAHSY